MIARPSYILPSELDIGEADFAAKRTAWTDQMRSEINQTIALTRGTITATRILLAEADILLARR